MSNILTVSAAGKFGPKMQDGEWYGLKKPLKPTDFVTGESYEVELEEWKPGRFNILKAKSVNVETLPAKEKKQVKAATKKVDDYQTSRDEGQKEGNRRNVAAVITQGLVIAHQLDTDKAFEAYENIHDKLVKADK